MRVMVIIKATEESEAGLMPSQQLLTDMMKFNEELVTGVDLSPTAVVAEAAAEE
jgi:hypothetical protein